MESYLTLLPRLVIVAFVAVVASSVSTPVAQSIIKPLSPTAAKQAPEDSSEIQESPNRRAATFTLICIAIFILGIAIMLAWQTRSLVVANKMVLELRGNVRYEPALASFLLKQFQSETTIDLCFTELDDSNMPNFTSFPRLRSLRIASTGVLNKSADVVSRCKSLRSLDISETNVGDEFIEQICKLPKLETILASDTRISDNCVESLAKMKSLKKIECLNTELTSIGAGNLRELKPELIVRFAQ